MFMPGRKSSAVHVLSCQPLSSRRFGPLWPLCTGTGCSPSLMMYRAASGVLPTCFRGNIRLPQIWFVRSRRLWRAASGFAFLGSPLRRFGALRPHLLSGSPFGLQVVQHVLEVQPHVSTPVRRASVSFGFSPSIPHTGRIQGSFGPILLAARKKSYEVPRPRPVQNPRYIRSQHTNVCYNNARQSAYQAQTGERGGRDGARRRLRRRRQEDQGAAAPQVLAAGGSGPRSRAADGHDKPDRDGLPPAASGYGGQGRRGIGRGSRGSDRVAHRRGVGSKERTAVRPIHRGAWTAHFSEVRFYPLARRRERAEGGRLDGRALSLPLAREGPEGPGSGRTTTTTPTTTTSTSTSTTSTSTTTPTTTTTPMAVRGRQVCTCQNGGRFEVCVTDCESGLFPCEAACAPNGGVASDVCTPNAPTC